MMRVHVLDVTGTTFVASDLCYLVDQVGHDHDDFGDTGVVAMVRDDVTVVDMGVGSNLLNAFSLY